jgi:hypothetical protein
MNWAVWTILLIWGGFFLWFFIGCCVLSSIDKDNRLFNWAKSGGPFLYCHAVISWPYITYVIMITKKEIIRGINREE